jgi:hypothetical protein
MAAYAVSGNQWIGFDTPQTLYMKIQAASKRGVGGLMVGWQLQRRPDVQPAHQGCDCGPLLVGGEGLQVPQTGRAAHLRYHQ